jgi:hypothetical protein
MVMNSEELPKASVTPRKSTVFCLNVLSLIMLAVGVAMVIAPAATVITIHIQHGRAFDALLTAEAKQLLRSSVDDPTNVVLFPDSYITDSESRLTIIYADGSFMVSASATESRLTMGKREVDVAAGRARSSLRTITGEHGQKFRAITLPIQRQPGAALVFARSTRSVDRSLHTPFVIAVTAAVAGAGLIVLSGSRAARSRKLGSPSSTAS